MKIFVASWFFPPATSSEGIVTYKLLRNSNHQYDVFSSTSKQWGYQNTMQQLNDKNLRCFTISTDSIDEWVEACIEQFEKLYSVEQYECIMTRSMPPESILIGKHIKEKYPQIKWIASLADPIANNPYEIKAYIDDCLTLNNKEKEDLKIALKSSNAEAIKSWEQRPESGVKLLCKLRRWQAEVIKNADLIISPMATQLSYMEGQAEWNPKYFAVPHSFDESLYPIAKENVHKKLIFSYIGYSDRQRSLEPIVRAIRLLKQRGCPFLNQLEIRFIGNNPQYIKDMVLNYFLDDVIQVRDGVGYYESLRLMRESDWLIHVDAYFEELSSGGSIFFAGKLADYMGAKRPILALTGKGSPADEIISKYGGIRLDSSDIAKIADLFEEILVANLKPVINEKYRAVYDARNVAQEFDKRIEQLCGLRWGLRCSDFIEVPPSKKPKLVTICVPGYNVERYLERCIRSLLDHKFAEETEILIIDDGSRDHTPDIAKIFEIQYPGIVRLIQKENGGHGSTINRAISEGVGKYFMVVDGDDWIDGKQFSQVLEKVKNGSIDTDIISSNYHEVNMESGESTPWIQQATIEYGRALPFDGIDVENVYFTLASTMFKLSLLRETNKPLQEHTFYVDVEYILFPIPYVKTVMFVENFIYKYCRGNAEQSVHIPTMVNRYDHHERVMKRVLEYETQCSIAPKQKVYYDSILKRLLYTHYALCFVYDSDKNRGYLRAKEFDEYLFKTNSELAVWSGISIPALRIARRYQFDFQKISHSISGKLYNKCYHLKPTLKSMIKSNKIIRRMIFNRYTLKLSKTKFFTVGPGRQIKELFRKFM